MEEEKEIFITKTVPDYAQTTFYGICGPNVDIEDIQKKIYHPYFGGRGATICNGHWKAIRHDD